ncbi:hemolysin family protein [Crocinitomicaceae bacterium]|jgi:CBS domain containing-hemolysin-like protein|nr:hemolysin family protein [Crocinitomicaceae bacterium]
MEASFIGIIITLVFSAFFSGLEIAYISSNRLKIELDKSKGTLSSKVLGVFYKNEAHFIAMLLLGNNISLVFFGLCSADVLEPVIYGWGIHATAIVLFIQTVFSTALVLVVAEFLPKAIVQINPNGYLKYTVVPMLFIYGILYFPTHIISAISSAVLKLFRIDSETDKKVFSKVDLEHYVQDINDRMKDEEEFGNEMQILQNALDFDSVKARDCMVPRTELISVEIEDSIQELQQKFIDTGKTKILVYRENIDNIIGYVHSFEIFKKPEEIKQILLPMIFVPEATPGKELLELFTKSSGNIAVVVDEYGGTSGIVTIEDVIEEIFGEIEDEFDTEDLLEEKLGENEYRFSARLEIDYLNDTYEFTLSENEEYETLGGFIIHHVANIPKAGTRLEVEGLLMEIEEVSHNRIDVVHLKVVS